MTDSHRPENSFEPAALRAHLLGVEPPNVARLEQLQQEVRTVFTQELTRSSRVSWRVSLGFSLLGAVFGAYVATHINAPDAVASPRALRAVWGLFTLAMVLSALYSVTVLRAGQVDLRNKPTRARVKLFIALATAVLLVIQAVTHPTIPMLAWAVFGLIWVVVSAANKVISTVELSERTTREAMLRLELRLAEAAERR